MAASIWTVLEVQLVSVIPEVILAIHFYWKQKRREKRAYEYTKSGKKSSKNVYKGYGIYRIGFVNIHGKEDETELDAMNINDLERLWLSLCPEFECKGNSVRYVERVG